VIHLKRFHYAGPWRDKLNTFIDYPMRNLDLTKYVLQGSGVSKGSEEGSRDSQPEMPDKYLYDLYAVTNHFGTLSGGHCTYPFNPHQLTDTDTATIHNNLRGKWYVFDDSRVSQCDETSVVVVICYRIVC
jgi:ubiquitin carboxyl-terminal hydrolase 8